MYLKNVLYFLILFYSQICFIICVRDLPSYYPRCYRDDPNLSQCMLKATEQVRPFLQKGVPELNVPPISPFFIPEINLKQATGAVNYQATLKNVLITGLDTYKFRKIDFDVDRLYFTAIVDMGMINIQGDYVVKGEILTVPIAGKGEIILDIATSNATFSEAKKLISRKGITYLEDDKTFVKVGVGEVKVQLSDLFDGNEKLADAVNDVIKENLREVVHEVEPAVEEVLTKFLVEILFKGLSRIPYDKLYPIHNN